MSEKLINHLEDMLESTTRRAITGVKYHEGERDVYQYVTKIVKKDFNENKQNLLGKLSDLQELLSNAQYQPLSDTEKDGQIQAALDIVNDLLKGEAE